MHYQQVEQWFAHEPNGIDRAIAKFVYHATFTRSDGLLLGAFVAVTQREVRHPVSQIWRRLRLPIFIGTALARAGLYVWATGLNDYDQRVISIGYPLPEAEAQIPRVGMHFRTSRLATLHERQ